MENLFTGITGGATDGRIRNLSDAMREFGIPAEAFDIEECQDEKTGHRFGRAACRRGYAVKIGGGGRNRGSRYAYQVWAVVKPEYRNNRRTD
jgi:hypothetical protein